MKKSVVTFHYTLTNGQGETLDSSRGTEPLSYLEGVKQIIPGLESQIKDLAVGAQKKVHVKATDAYGTYDDSMIVTVPRTEFKEVEDLEVGDQFQADTSGNGDMRIFTVLEVTDATVKMDGNHPLAGQDLFFDVEIVDRRDATEEELTHGHAHGPDGHHHH